MIDSDGFGNPILNEKDNLESVDLSDKEKNDINEKIKEILITEFFLQKYIIRYSDILILVVGFLTFSDQKLINRIKTYIRKLRIDKPIFIIHNLKEFNTIEQVENYMINILIKSASFKLEEVSTKYKSTWVLYFHEKKFNSNNISFNNSK